MPKTDSLQGSLDLLVLKILSRRPGLHRYALMTAIEEISDDVLRVEEGYAHQCDLRINPSCGANKTPGAAARAVV